MAKGKPWPWVEDYLGCAHDPTEALRQIALCPWCSRPVRISCSAPSPDDAGRWLLAETRRCSSPCRFQEKISHRVH